MTILEIILLLLFVIQGVANAWLASMLYKTGILVLTVQDTLEDSLEIIDNRIDSIDEILAIPLFSDSPEIKRLKSDMTRSRDAMMDVANALSSSMSEENEAPETQT